jgi:hypothetical protein
MRRNLFLLFTLLLTSAGISAPLYADDVPECLEDVEHAVFQQSFTANLINGVEFHAYLPTERMNQIVPTPAQVHALFSTETMEQWARLFFDLKLPPGQHFGLPYTVFAVRVSVSDHTQANHFHYFADYTKDCAPGRSFFPGGSFYLPEIKIPAAATGQLRQEQTIEIKIWGERS